MQRERVTQLLKRGSASVTVLVLSRYELAAQGGAADFREQGRWPGSHFTGLLVLCDNFKWQRDREEKAQKQVGL